VRRQKKGTALPLLVVVVCGWLVIIINSVLLFLVRFVGIPLLTIQGVIHSPARRW
jgi:predicted membrane channel-forming protein YqfA (hemolysin III family)